MSVTPNDQLLRRHFIALATSDYDDPRLAPLSGIRDEVSALRGWLCDQGLADRAFTEPYPELASNPTEDQIHTALRRPGPAWTPADGAVVFITGHGLDRNGTHWIAVQDTDPDRPMQTAIRTADVIGWLAETGIDHLVIIVDLCFAGAAANDTIRFDHDFKPSWLVLAGATRHERAATGAVTAFLADLNSPSGVRFSHGPFLYVNEFLEAIQARLPAGQRLAHLQPALPNLAGTSPLLPNPHWKPDATSPVQPARRDLAIRPEDLEAHWGPRARGVTEHGDPGWLFSGRVQLMHRLIAAATGPAATVVVTGGAGSGKSAALARLVTLADPAFRTTYATEVATIPADRLPAEGAVDAAVLATGKLSHEVLGQICEALAVPLPTAGGTGPSLPQLRDAWWAWLTSRGTLVTIVVDALDEAPYPRSVLTEVLAQLNPPTPAAPMVRLLVGVRSPRSDESAATPAAASRVLADRAETELDAARLSVDETPLWVSQDVVDYVRAVLTATEGSPYAAGHSALHDVADAVAAKSGTSYLFARVAATSLAHRAEPIKVDDHTWQSALDSGIVGVFRDDLHTTLTNAADRERAVHLLRATAFAYGRGLPWNKIWPLVANAVADHPERTYGDGDIAWLLESRLAAYLVKDREDDITVYRPFHETLRTTLRDRWAELLTNEPR